MPDYTITTENHQINKTADRFSKDDRGDLYLYNDSDADPVGHVPAGALEAIVERGGMA